MSAGNKSPLAIGLFLVVFAAVSGMIGWLMFGPGEIPPEKVYDAVVAGEPGCEVVRPTTSEFNWDSVDRQVRQRTSEIPISQPADVIDVRCAAQGVTIRMMVFNDRHSTLSLEKNVYGPVDQLEVIDVQASSGTERISVGHGTASKDGDVVSFSSATGRRHNVWISVVGDKSDDELRAIWRGAANALPQ